MYQIATVIHIVFFCHGLTPIGTIHNTNMKELLQPMMNETTVIHPLSSLSSKWILYGAYHLLGGVDHCSDLLLEEIYETLDRYPNANKVSFIGSSMGGINFRHVVWKLCSKSNLITSDSIHHDLSPDVIYINPIRHITLHTYVSLASPHLGADQETFWLGSTALNIGSYIAITISDLLVGRNTHDSISGMGSDEHLCCMRKFHNLVTFVPEIDDGIVHPASAAIDTKMFNRDEINQYTSLEQSLNTLQWNKIVINDTNHKGLSRLWTNDPCRNTVAQSIIDFINK
jgi:hypothetical protein